MRGRALGGRAQHLAEGRPKSVARQEEPPPEFGSRLPPAPVAAAPQAGHAGFRPGAVLPPAVACAPRGRRCTPPAAAPAVEAPAARPGGACSCSAWLQAARRARRTAWGPGQVGRGSGGLRSMVQLGCEALRAGDGVRSALGMSALGIWVMKVRGQRGLVMLGDH